MDEKFLYHIWDAGHLKTDLKTISGKPIKIVYQGQFNTNRGPDFCNVILQIGDEAIKGNVEIHLKTGDWQAHSHDDDYHYDSVILHVVLKHNQAQDYTIRADGTPIEILELDKQLSEDIQKLLAEHIPEQEAGLNRYCELLSAIDNDSLIVTLGLYGKLRFHSKVRRFNAMLSISDFDQLLYEGMMEAMGYDKNKLNLIGLAQSIPIAMIRKWYLDGLKREELISIFLCSSGLLSRCGKLLPGDYIAELWRIYELQHHYARRLATDWQLFRIRPLSHPVYRLIALLNLIYDSLGTGTLSYFLSVIEAECSDHKQRLKFFMQLFACPTEPKMPRPGKSLINTMLINIYLPVLYLYYDKHALYTQRDRILADWMSADAFDDNHITRFMSKHINENQRSKINTRASYQQGLIELYHRHCRYHLCTECQKAWNDLKNI